MNDALDFLPFGGGATGSDLLPTTFHDCEHSALPPAEYSPTITNVSMPSGEILPATENTPFIPSSDVAPDLDFALIFQFLPTEPSISGVRSMSTVIDVPRVIFTSILPCGYFSGDWQFVDTSSYFTS